MSKLVMGYWDCPVCGTKEIRGDVANCPSCGRARGDVQFYMKGYNEGETREEDERSDVEYLDEEQAKYVSKNPDWYCSFCNSLNNDKAQVCGNCGATRADSEANYFEMLKKKEEREAAELAAQPQVSSGPQKKSRRKKHGNPEPKKYGHQAVFGVKYDMVPRHALCRSKQIFPLIHRFIVQRSTQCRNL